MASPVRGLMLAARSFAARSSLEPAGTSDRAAWEAADVAGLVALLREDAVLTMPPKPTVTGAGQIGTFIGEAIFTIAPMRLLEAHSNGTPAFAAYIREGSSNRFVPFALLVISSDGRHITQIDAFVEPRVLARFELPAELAG